jgi:hypothetical protein
MKASSVVVIISLAGAVGCGGNAVTSPSPSAGHSASATTLQPTAVDPQSATSKDITIVGGRLVVDNLQSGTASLRGTKGFELDGTLLEGAYPAEGCLGGDECAPGTSVSLSAGWSGLDLPGTVKLQGTTYTVGGFDGPGALIRLSGTFTAPPQGSNATVTAPFTMTGLFEQINQPLVPFGGKGTATITLQWSPANTWQATAIRFDILGK